MQLFRKLLYIINSGHERTVTAKRNIAISALAKTVSIATSFLIVPLSLDLLGTERYGVWLTIGSVVGWIALCDVGIGSGLRTKLGEALAVKNLDLGRVYVSTSYCMVAFIVSIAVLLFALFKEYIQLDRFLSVPSSLIDEATLLFFIVLLLTGLRFIFQLINQVFLADQRTAYRDVIEMTSKLILLGSLYLFNQLKWFDLMLYGALQTGGPVCVLFVTSVIYYTGRYKDIKPSLSYLQFDKAKSLLSLSASHFIIQVGWIVMLSTDNLIISNILGPDQVSIYQVALQYYTIPIVVFLTAMAPLWSAVTDAFAKDDWQWIDRTMKKIMKLWGAVAVVVLLMYAFSGPLIRVWIGDRLVVPNSLLIGMVLFALVRTANSPFSTFLNGIGNVKRQMYGQIIIVIVNIPLGIFFGKTMGLGLSGVILATDTCLFFLLIITMMQYKQIVTDKMQAAAQ